MPDAFRLYVGDWLAYEWRFDVVRLWEIDAERRSRVARRGRWRSCRCCGRGRAVQGARGGAKARRDAPAEGADAMSALLDLAAQRYDRATFMNVLGKDRVMESWLWQFGRRRGRGQGRGQGRGPGSARQDLRRPGEGAPPAQAAPVLPAIEACDRPETLRSWALQCAKLL